jgi:pyrimidine-nucleoside phosphorylase
MNQPLGDAVGNALEVREAIATLHGGGPADFREHCLALASHLLLAGGKCPSLAEARAAAEAGLASGKAWEKFRVLVQTQGGDVSYVDHPEKLPRAAVVETVAAPRSGWLAQVNARVIGETSVDLGAGRARKGDPIDYGVGILVHHKVGERVEKGDALFTVHARNHAEAEKAGQALLGALEWSERPVEPLPLFYGVVE